MFFIFLFVSCVTITLPACGQDVKKSTKTETVEGKTYYLHTVEKKQTLYAIAKAYGVTVNDIVLENPATMGEIKAGQVLRIPAFKPSATTTTTRPDTAKYFYHKVEAGQTLYAISKLYNVKPEAIEALNPDVKSGGIKTGQSLKIPGVATTTGTGTLTTVIADTTKPKLKDSYNVALMLPFQLEKVDGIEIKDLIHDKQSFPAKMEVAVQFYEGALLALDSLRRTGMNVKLYAYDADDVDSAQMSIMLQKPEFANMDLFIGPLYPAVFKPVAKFAMEHHIPAVSPVSQSNRPLFKNSWTSKTIPSLSTQMEQLAQYVAKWHASDNVIVIGTSSTKDAAYVNAFQKMYNTTRYPSGSDSVRVLKGVTGLDALISATGNNVIIVPSTSQVFVTDLLRSLNAMTDKDKKKFTLYGMPNWMTYENLDFSYLQNLNFHYATPYFIDYSDSLTKHFLRTYLQTYKGDASQYAFQGYDVTMFYLKALQQYGSGLQQKLPELKYTGLQQCFDFYQTDSESGYENRGVQIISMQDYLLVKERK